jgi:hypothetical protein
LLKFGYIELSQFECKPCQKIRLGVGFVGETLAPA